MVSRTTFLFPLAAAGVLATGCASLPATGTQATGERLSVKSGIVTEQYTVKEKVGEVEHTDANGRSLGKSEVYQDRLQTVQREVWSGYQGSRKIDDHDFFRIGGDIEAADRIIKSREAGVTMNRVGIGLLAAGAAAVIGGYVTRSSDPTASNTGSTALLLGGGVLVPVGAVLTWVGIMKAKAEHPVNDRERAMEVAGRYNAGLVH